MKQFIKAAIFTAIFSVVFGTILAFYQKNDIMSMTIEAYDSVTNEPISGLKINSLPDSYTRYDENMAGEGRKVIAIRHFFFAYISVSVEGYKKESKIVYLTPEKVVAFHLDTLDPSIYDKYKEKEPKVESRNETKPKKDKEPQYKMDEFIDKLNKKNE